MRIVVGSALTAVAATIEAVLLIASLLTGLEAALTRLACSGLIATLALLAGLEAALTLEAGTLLIATLALLAGLVAALTLEAGTLLIATLAGLAWLVAALALEAGTLLVATLTLLAGLIASLTGCARLITPCLCIAGSIAAVCRTGNTRAQHASIGTHLLLVCVVVTI